LKLRTDTSIVVVSPARTVSTGYLVVTNKPLMPAGGSAAWAAMAENTTTTETAMSRRTMPRILPFRPPRRPFAEVRFGASEGRQANDDALT
jgi:hypothetical protein